MAMAMDMAMAGKQTELILKQTKTKTKAQGRLLFWVGCVWPMGVLHAPTCTIQPQTANTQHGGVLPLYSPFPDLAGDQQRKRALALQAVGISTLRICPCRMPLFVIVIINDTSIYDY
jgi:hypothetical protein